MLSTAVSTCPASVGSTGGKKFQQERRVDGDVGTFAYVDGVWITEFRFAVPLAVALRQSLIDIATTRQAYEGQATKMGRR
jgi:hypothetical protein